MTVNFTSKEVEWIATILADRCDRSTRIFEISAIRTEENLKLCQVPIFDK